MNDGSDISARKYLFLFGYGNPQAAQIVVIYSYTDAGKTTQATRRQRRPVPDAVAQIER
jgi:hypothetical protein